MNSAISTRLRSLGEAVPGLRAIFSSLSSAHAAFQAAGALRFISVSDMSERDTIEATFHGTRIKFQLICALSAEGKPIGHVVCMHCHCTFGTAVQDYLGDFSYDTEGLTLPDGQQSDDNSLKATRIVMRFLEAALHASTALGRNKAGPVAPGVHEIRSAP